MRILITGVAGFVGPHLVRELRKKQDTNLIGAVIGETSEHENLQQLGVRIVQVDLKDQAAVSRLLGQFSPDHIYHLAAQSFVPQSFQDPWGTLENNIRSQLNIIQAIIDLKLEARLLIVGSSEEYGSVRPEDNPISEEQPLRPNNPYSVSKVAQDMLGLQFFLSHKLDVVRVRAFNHTGPGQSGRFVAPAFASQIARVERGLQPPVLQVGTLTARRDFSDVRDIVKAYVMTMEKGEAGEVYNIGNGTAHSIQEMLDILLGLTNRRIKVEVDPERVRPVEVPLIQCDISKIHKTTGWKPTLTFEQTLSDVLDDWRQRSAGIGD